MIKMCNFGSFHGLTRNVETVIYVFIASDRSRNCAACMKDRSLWWKIALCDNSYSAQPLLLCYSRLQRFISRNCWLLYKSSPSGSSWKYQRNIIVAWRLSSLNVFQLILSLLYDWTKDLSKTVAENWGPYCSPNFTFFNKNFMSLFKKKIYIKIMTHNFYLKKVKFGLLIGPPIL